MRQYSAFAIAGLASFMFWVIDAAILSFSHDLTLSAAMAAGAPAFHLVLRLVIAAFFVYLAWRYYCCQSGRPLRFDIFAFFTQIQDPRCFCGHATSNLQSERVLYHSMRLANYFKMNNEDRDTLRLFCYCYDIGQISVPSALLEKPKELTDTERSIWDRHIQIGVEIVQSIPELAKTAPLLRCYGEYYNGGGVLGLKGEDIPLACRIFTVAWLYDNMLHPVGMVRPMVSYEALEELMHYAHTVIDPQVLEAFIKIMGARSLFSVRLVRKQAVPMRKIAS